MNTRLMALDYIKRARRCLKEAQNALADDDSPMAVRRGQECVELGLKAVLRRLGVEYPKKHDVSDALEYIAGQVPTWFAARIPAFAALSSKLARERGPAMYGYEAELVPASQLFTRADAEERVAAVGQVFAACERLIALLDEKHISDSSVEV